VRDDLQGLEITLKEQQQFTSLPVNDELILVSKFIKRLVRQFIEKVKGSEGITVAVIGFSALLIIYIIFDFLIKIYAGWIPIPSFLLLLIFGGLALGCGQVLLYLTWKQKNKVIQENMTPSLRNILMDVNRYNSVIKAIDINDQIEEAGNPEVTISERNKVLEALNLTRIDLIRALKTERILRENKNFIISNTELFTNNLAALTAMQVTEKATEHGKLLNEALQIALDVQLEMKRLQQR
jgi:hypothetical protein